MEPQDKTDERLDKLENTVEKITTAFPGGDFSGHARYHEAVIRDLQDRREVRKAVLEQIIKGSVWALIVAVATGLWTYGKEHLASLFR